MTVHSQHLNCSLSNVDPSRYFAFASLHVVMLLTTQVKGGSLQSMYEGAKGPLPEAIIRTFTRQVLKVHAPLRVVCSSIRKTPPPV